MLNIKYETLQTKCEFVKEICKQLQCQINQICCLNNVIKVTKCQAPKLEQSRHKKFLAIQVMSFSNRRVNTVKYQNCDKYHHEFNVVCYLDKSHGNSHHCVNILGTSIIYTLSQLLQSNIFVKLSS